MSSTKSAEQLVEILNDLFERFDSLCAVYGCEKISTLGDCYYAVSGCPNVRVSSPNVRRSGIHSSEFLWRIFSQEMQ